MKRGKFLIIIFLLTIIPIVSSADFDHVISNSENWQDVYSVIHYSNLQGIENDFLTSTNHGTLLLNNIKKTQKIKVISSQDKPYVFNYPSLIESKGFPDPEEIKVKEANLELIDELKDIEDFIVVDDSYGYNAIAVVPYALKTNSWVFLANKYNIDEINNILSNRNVNKLILYGYMGKELTETLKGYNPEIIDNGDKFEDNIEIVEKFLNLEETKQVLLTNGEFIEKEIMGGLEPILFTGRQNVPDKIQTYLKNSPIEIGVLIGNELMSAATNIRRSTGIAVMVKFARGARSSGEGVSAVEGLDLFPVPKPTLSLNVESIKYNLLTNELEVTYRSDSNVPVYLRGTITINDGKETTRLGDTDSIFISPGNYKTISYALEIENSNGLNANVYTLFGETPTSMDYVFEAEYDVEAIEVLDRCEVEVLSTKYNKQSQEFIINVKNLAEVDCWSSLEIEDVSIGGKEMTLATENPVKISQKSSRKMIIKEELAEEDIEDNAFVNVVARYGERQTSLIKVFNGNFKLEIAVLTAMTYLAILALIVIAVLIFFYIKNKKEEEKGY